MRNDRRDFMKKMVASSVAIPFSKLLFSSEKLKKSKKFPINFFTKPLDKYGYDFMIDTLKIAGVDGLDLTVGQRVQFYRKRLKKIFLLLQIWLKKED